MTKVRSRYECKRLALTNVIILLFIIYYCLSIFLFFIRNYLIKVTHKEIVIKRGDYYNKVNDCNGDNKGECFTVATINS